VFAILGVVIPLTSQFWDSYVKQYLDPDLFAIILFVIGFVVTFIYIWMEVSSIFFGSPLFARALKKER